jgi:hypothetical protein
MNFGMAEMSVKFRALGGEVYVAKSEAPREGLSECQACPSSGD